MVIFNFLFFGGLCKQSKKSRFENSCWFRLKVLLAHVNIFLEEFLRVPNYMCVVHEISRIINPSVTSDSFQ